MKNIKSYILSVSILLAGIFTGCNNSFLEEIPRDELSDASFWKSQDDVEKFTTSLYRYTLDPGNYVIMLDSYTDNAVPIHVSAAQGQISAGRATSDNAHFKQVWKATYQGIRRCNICLQNIDQVPMSETVKDIYKGEAYFLRGFFYATLLRLYGGVPLLEKPLDLNEAIPARNTEEEVYNFIINDLDKAVSLLPKKQEKLGRATKGAALAEKAVISNFMNKYENAAQFAKSVIDMNLYSLYPNYGDLFSPDHENNEEVIFDHQYMENAKDYNLGSWIDQYFAPRMIGGWEAVSPTKDLVDLYECKDGKSIEESAMFDENNPFANRDPRFDYTILYEGKEFAGQEYKVNIGAGNSTRTGYTICKYINPQNAGMNYPGWTNFIYIRYAEILLIYAEAQNEISGPDPTVYKAVNDVRARVGMPPLPENLTKDQMRERIRKERRIEFAFEGIHLFDLRRWKTAEKALTKPVYGMKINGDYLWVETRDFNPERDYRWAIPLNEIDLSQGTLTQNPGW